MKKFLAVFIVMAVFAVVLPVVVSAQGYCRTSGRTASYRNAYSSYNNGRYRRASNPRNYRAPVYYSASQPAYAAYPVRRPGFYRRHRNVINMALGTGGGALIGGMLGGRKGALIGALAGAGGSALYTYKLNPKRPRYNRY